VTLFEQIKEALPPMQAEGKRYGGLSLCKLLERRHGPQPFFALPTDLGEETCDLSSTILAYGGWCAVGVEDPSGPHFSQPILPSVEIVSYDGGWTVIYLNHYLKSHIRRTPVGAHAAAAFFQHLPAVLDIRSPHVPLFPAEYFEHLPPRRAQEEHEGHSLPGR